MKFQVVNDDIRLDNFLAEALNTSRSQVTKMIKNKEVLVNGKIVKPGFLLKSKDYVVVNHADLDDTLPEKMELDIVYEDDDVLVVNKANGVVVHPGAGNHHGTLVNGLLYHTKLSNINGLERPGIVHRIDAYTTGLLMVAKNNKAHEILADELANKKTYRKYIALVWGVILNDTGEIDAPIGRSKNDRKKMAVRADGKKAITHFRVLKRFEKATLIELKLETGRTHQIRVHMKAMGHPIYGDTLYGETDDSGLISRQALHAYKLKFQSPRTKDELALTAKLPADIEKLIANLKEAK